MTQLLSTSELAGMRASQADFYNDTCKVGVYSTASRDAHGVPVATYTYGSAIACGFGPSAGQQSGGERRTSTTTVVSSDARVRLPVGTSIASRDRIRVTHRHGTDVTDVDYEIRAIVRGPSGLVVDVDVVST